MTQADWVKELDYLWSIRNLKGITKQEFDDLVSPILTLAQQRTEKKWRDKCEKLKKRKNPHSGHEIDDYYCIECGVEIKTHPDETMGYNKALSDLNN